MARYQPIPRIQAQFPHLRDSGLANDSTAGGSDGVGFAQQDAAIEARDEGQCGGCAGASVVPGFGTAEESAAGGYAGAAKEISASAAAGAGRGGLWGSGLSVAGRERGKRGREGCVYD